MVGDSTPNETHRPPLKGIESPDIRLSAKNTVNTLLSKRGRDTACDARCMLFTPNLHECTTPCFFPTINLCILVTSTDQNYKPPMQQLYDNSAWLYPICVFVFWYSGRWRHKLWNDMAGIFGCHMCLCSGLSSIFFTWAFQAEKCLSSNVCCISSSVH